MHETTQLLRATLTAARQGDPLHSGPVFAAPFHAIGDASESPYTYARYHNPSWTELETALSLLETDGSFAAQTYVFPSGMAAIAAVFGTVLRPGDVAVLPSNAYYATRRLMESFLVPMGVKVRLAPTGGDAQGALLQGARLLWLETPNNPQMEIADITRLSSMARERGALVAVDNSTPTALSQKPLALGADFSVTSGAKMLNGHSDVLYGHVAVKDTALAGSLDSWRRLTGSVLGPMEAWLALRSLATLPLRLERACFNAKRVAEFLTTRSDVTNVLYPGLPTHKDHSLAARQMKYFGPVVSFTLPSAAAADAFLNEAELITQATSFGSVITTGERRLRWSGDAVPEGFVRLSIGCEAVEDLVADIEKSLNLLKNTSA